MIMEKKFTSEELKEFAEKMFWLGFEKAQEVFDAEWTSISDETKDQLRKFIQLEIVKLITEPKATWSIDESRYLYSEFKDLIKKARTDEELRLIVNGMLNELECFISKGSFFTVEHGDNSIIIKAY